MILTLALIATMSCTGSTIIQPDTTYYDSAGKRTIDEIITFHRDSATQRDFMLVRDFRFNQARQYFGSKQKNDSFVRNGPYYVTNRIMSGDTIISGFYSRNNKDSIETYFFKDSFGNSRIIRTENWDNGSRTGTWIDYYPGGQVYRRMIWQDEDFVEVRVGIYFRTAVCEYYYKSGKVRNEGKVFSGGGRFVPALNKWFVESPLFTGPFPEGSYYNWAPVGEWVFYDQRGKKLGKINFRMQAGKREIPEKLPRAIARYKGF